MFQTYQALVFVKQSDIPTNAIFYRLFLFLKLKFLPDHTFERMSARLCAMETSINVIDTNTDTAYAATGDHHLFLLTVATVLAATIHGGYLHLVELLRYDIPAAFLQGLLTPENCPRPLYGRLPSDLPPDFKDRYVKFNKGIYGTKVANRIFDLDHTATLRSMGYETFIGDERKFLWTCPSNPILKVIINTHVDDGGVILTCKRKYEETLHYLNLRYPGDLDVSSMNRYLGMGFDFNPRTGSLTVSMLHSVLKLLATCCTETLPPQRTPYTKDLFDTTTDPHRSIKSITNR